MSGLLFQLCGATFQLYIPVTRTLLIASIEHNNKEVSTVKQLTRGKNTCTLG